MPCRFPVPIPRPPTPVFPQVVVEAASATEPDAKFHFIRIAHLSARVVHADIADESAGCNDFDIILGHLSSLASNAASAVPCCVRHTTLLGASH